MSGDPCFPVRTTQGQAAAFRVAPDMVAFLVMFGMLQGTACWWFLNRVNMLLLVALSSRGECTFGQAPFLGIVIPSMWPNKFVTIGVDFGILKGPGHGVCAAGCPEAPRVAAV